MESTKVKLKEVITLDKCKDYDSDCKNVANHFKCWIGNEAVINGVTYYVDTAKGICPFLPKI